MSVEVCNGAALPNDPVTEVACAAVGCSSAIALDADSGLFVVGERFRVEVCAAERCATQHIRPNGPPPTTDNTTARPRSYSVALPDGDYSDVDVVSVTVTNATTNELITLSTVDVDFEPTRPNGPDCPPTCWSADVRL